jgi:hypothetical protein
MIDPMYAFLCADADRITYSYVLCTGEFSAIKSLASCL